MGVASSELQRTPLTQNWPTENPELFCFGIYNPTNAMLHF